MGKVLEKLELKGLVFRARNPSDGRSIRTGITNRGNTLLRRIDQTAGASAESAGSAEQNLRTALITLIARLEATPA
jgi:DNA-binding MarR family transcriptional regulator